MVVNACLGKALSLANFVSHHYEITVKEKEWKYESVMRLRDELKRSLEMHRSKSCEDAEQVARLSSYASYQCYSLLRHDCMNNGDRRYVDDLYRGVFESIKAIANRYDERDCLKGLRDMLIDRIELQYDRKRRSCDLMRIFDLLHQSGEYIGAALALNTTSIRLSRMTADEERVTETSTALKQMAGLWMLGHDLVISVKSWTSSMK